jgi:hypothetical protein
MRVITITGLTLALALAAAATACGPSEQQRQADEAKKQLEQAQKQIEEAGKQAQAAGKEVARQAQQAGKEIGRDAGQNAQQAVQEASKGLEALAKGLQGLQTGPDGKLVEPVSFHDLQAVFVPLDGWEMGKPTGEKMSVPVSFSQAKVTYRKGDARIEATVMDSGFNQLLIAPFTMFLTTGYEKETENGYEKSVKVAGNPGWEKWESTSKNGELNTFINKRFLVQLHGTDISDIAVLHQLADASNLAKLATMK